MTLPPTCVFQQVKEMSVVRPPEHRISWQEKKRILSNLYGRGGLVVVCETGVIVHEAPPNSNSWRMEDYGVPTIISNLQELVISIVDFETAEPHREYSITAECDYRVQKDHFHTFICEDDDGSDLLVGLSFANSEVARRVAEAVDQLTPGKLFKLSENKRNSLTKDSISQPSDFRHVTHIGNDLPPQADPIGGLSAIEQQTGNGVTSMEVSTQIPGTPQQKNEPSPPQGKEVCAASPPQETKVRRPTPTHGLHAQAKRLLNSASSTKKSKKGVRRVIDISSPMEFKHVAHVGDDCFAPKNEHGKDDPFQLSGDYTGAERKRSKSSSPSDQLVSSGEEPESKKSRVPMEISSPKDFQHIAHVSKDTAISAFLLTGKKDPFSVITAIASSPPKPTSPPVPPVPSSPPKIPVPPEPPSLPKIQPSEPCKVFSPPKIAYPPPPPQMDHSEFLEEINSFNPSFLRHVSTTKKGPAKDPNSLQEILKKSLENMRGKLQGYWRESIITTFADQQDGDDEFDYPGVYLPEEVRIQLEE